MFENMFGKFGGLKKKMEEAKSRLDGIIVEGQSADGSIKVTANGNRKIKEFQIDDSLLTLDHKTRLKENLLEAANDVLSKAENVYETEMKNAAKDLLPNIPGMF